MSYSVFITTKDNKNKDIPFSTNKNYDQVILPIANQLNLSKIIEIQYGITIQNESELIQFINELQEIKNSKLISILDRYNLERIDFLISELEVVKKENQYKSIEIG